jgi:GDP-D-mannose dehydratase
VEFSQYLELSERVLATREATAVHQFIETAFEKLGRKISFSGLGVVEKVIDQRGNVLIEIDSRYFWPTEVPHLSGEAS